MVFNIAICKSRNLDSLTIASLTVSLISMLLYGTAALFVYRKIIIVHKADQLCRRRPDTTWADDTSLISTEEMQRRQLLRLLFNKDADRMPSPELQGTFHIDLPDANIRVSRDNVSDMRLMQPPTSTRSRSVPPPSQTWDMPSPPRSASRSASPTSRELRKAEIESWGIGSREVSRDREDVSVGPRILRVQTEGFNVRGSL